jgi:hypothetical protein
MYNFADNAVCLTVRFASQMPPAVNACLDFSCPIMGSAHLAKPIIALHALSRSVLIANHLTI